MAGKRPRPLLLFYIIVVYVLIQFGWWTYLLVKLNNEINLLQRQLVEVQAYGTTVMLNSNELVSTEKELNDKLHKQWMMIFGEGSVFLILLLLGILQTRKSFHHEAELNARQKNFILSVTHELRSPLASMRLQIETVQKRDLPKEKQQEMFASAIEDIDRLNTLIENILVASRIEDHSYLLNKAEGDLSSTLQELVLKAEKGFAAQHSFVHEIEQGITTSFDKVGLHSVVVNLLENAVKYSAPGTSIGLSLKKEKQEAVMRVSDRGPGISAKEKKHIFERFYRSGNEETRRTKGTGLGLYIVQNLVNAHGWTISVEDNTPSGSIFTIRIPLS